MSKNPYMHFDLPVDFINPAFDHITPKLQEDNLAEIARLRNLPPGTACVEAEYAGLIVTCRMLDALASDGQTESPDFAITGDDTARAFATQSLGPALYISGFYNACRTQSKDGVTDVTRRRLFLPRLLDADGQRIPNAVLFDNARARCHEAIPEAYALTQSHINQSKGLEKKRVDFGRHLGTAAISLAAARINAVVHPTSEFEAQKLVRDQAIELRRHAAQAHRTANVNPSLAGLGRRNSHFSHYMHRTAPRSVQQALEAATEGMPLVA